MATKKPELTVMLSSPPVCVEMGGAAGVLTETLAELVIEE